MCIVYIRISIFKISSYSIFITRIVLSWRIIIPIGYKYIVIKYWSLKFDTYIRNCLHFLDKKNKLSD